MKRIRGHQHYTSRLRIHHRQSNTSNNNPTISRSSWQWRSTQTKLDPRHSAHTIHDRSLHAKHSLFYQSLRAPIVAHTYCTLHSTFRADHQKGHWWPDCFKECHSHRCRVNQREKLHQPVSKAKHEQRRANSPSSDHIAPIEDH